MPEPSADRFRRWTLGLYACAFTILVGGMSWYLSQTWREQLNQTRSQLHALAQLTHQAVQLQFDQYARSLRLLAWQLKDTPEQDPSILRRELAQFAQSDAGIAVLNLVRSDGRVLISTGAPSNAAMPDLNADPALRGLLDRARAQPLVLQLLHPTFSPLIHRLVIHLAMSATTPNGALLYLVGGIDMSQQVQLYRDLLTPRQRGDGEVIGLLGQDGYLYGAWPLPGKVGETGGRLEGFLQQPRNGALHQFLLKHPGTAQGDVEGLINVGLSNTEYLGAFQQLRGFPLYASVFAPKPLVWAKWWKIVLAPLIGAGLALTLLTLIMGLSLRLQRQWFQDAQRKNEQLRLACEGEARQNAALGLLGQSLSMAMRASDTQAIFQGLCALATEQLGCALVWVGCAEATGRRQVTPIASAGQTGYLHNIQIALNDAGFEQGPFARCIKSGKPAFSTINAPEFRPWHAQAKAYGIEEILALPLPLESGALDHAVVFYGTVSGFFTDSHVVGTLLQMVQEVSLALQSLLTRQALDRSRHAESTANAHFHQILNNLPAGVIVFDANGLVQYCSRAFVDLYGLDLKPNSLVGRPWRDVWSHVAPMHAHPEAATRRLKLQMHQNEPAQDEIKLANGRVFLGNYVPLHDGHQPGGAVWSLQDITSLKTQEAQIKQLIDRDPLTGLFNRRAFDARLAQCLDAHPASEKLVVGILDLDHFKNINDRLGHQIGDALLVEVSRRLASVLRDSDLLARLGGDEFGLILPDCPSTEQLGLIAERLLAAVEPPMDLDGHTEHISLSLGFTVYVDPSVGATTLLRQADMAMYAAKARGRRQYQIFGEAMEMEVARYESLLRWVASALREDRLELHFQPILSLRPDSRGRMQASVSKVEALLRLRDEAGNVHAAGIFEEVLDDPQLAVQIGRYVLHEAISQALRWRDQGLRLQICVNISPRHFLDQSFVADIQDALKLAPDGVAELIEVELTEHGAQLNGSRARQVVQACRLLGVCVSLDDFGTGSASLTHLQLLDVSTVKIDRCFTSDLFENDANLSITYGMLRTAQMMGLTVVAEGVETSRQALALFVMGCLDLQGYVIARPMPAAKLGTWVTQWQDQLPWVALMEHVLHVDDQAIQAIVAHGIGIRHLLMQSRGGPDHDFYRQVNAHELCKLGGWCSEQPQHQRDTAAYALLMRNHAAFHELVRHYLTAPGAVEASAVEAASQSVRTAFWDVVLGGSDSINAPRSAKPFHSANTFDGASM